ncbi:MAG: hypothetical protein IPK82_29865 [Polyangiaceae bacterium]|nr:hypothetical protein [Polyangiaceae bacterium]
MYDGTSYPANAVILFYGQEITLDAVTVNVIPPVNPADHTLVQTAVPFTTGSIAAVIDPPVPAGHTVEIAGDFCPPEYGCEPQVITYTVTEPDLTAPPVPTNLSFGVFDYPDYISGGGDCTVDSDLGYFLHATNVPAASGESPVICTITTTKNGSAQVVDKRSMVVSTQDLSVVVRLFAEQVGAANPAEALCFEFSSVDTSLNALPAPAPLCTPCYYRVESSPANPSTQPEEPTWTNADVYPGGPCDNGVGGSGGTAGSGGTGAIGGSGAAGGSGAQGGGGNSQDDSVSGCTCSVESVDSTGSGRFGLVGLGGVIAVLRRRRGEKCSRSSMAGSVAAEHGGHV